MFTAKLKYSGKSLVIKPYTTNLELDLLLINTINDEYSVDDVIEHLSDNVNVDISTLSKVEKLVILFKMRALSVGEEVAIKWKCSSCTMANEDVINVSEIVQHGEDDDKYKFFTEVPNDDNLHNFTDIDLNELTLHEFNELKLDIEKSITKFNFVKTISCMKCNHPQDFDISSDEYVCECMSEDTVSSLYKSIADLVFHGHYTKADVDGMLPFERSMYIGLLNETKESVI